MWSRFPPLRAALADHRYVPGRAAPAAGRIAFNKQGIFRHHPELDAR
jgi:hypothetical protein